MMNLVSLEPAMGATQLDLVEEGEKDGKEEEKEEVKEEEKTEKEATKHTERGK